MTESNYSRDTNDNFFLPLKLYHYSPNPYFFDKEQIYLAEKLGEYYNLPPGNMLRLIGYAEEALEWALKSEQMFSVDDWRELQQFEEQSEPLTKVTFQGKKNKFIIRNPYLIDILYKQAFEALKRVPKRYTGDDLSFGSPIEALLSRNPLDGKKRPSGDIIKLIGTEIYNDLIQWKTVTRRQAECILAQILSLYKVGLKKEPIMTERQYCDKHEGNASGYLSYCRGQGKNYHY